jgi:hypothetical protein
VAPIFDLGGAIRFALVDADARTTAYVERQMDPYAPREGRADDADVMLVAEERRQRLVDVQNPANDGIVTAATEDGRFVLVSDGRTFELPRNPEAGSLRLAYEPGFPLGRAFRTVVRPLLQLALSGRGAVAVHSATVELDGSAIVVAGWSETGKTETALALAERGARFISDKWTIAAPDGSVSAFPISVGIRQWVLRFLPTLRASLPAAARAQLLAARVASAVTRPVRSARPRGRIANVAVGAVDRAVALGERAALRPTQVRAAYGQDGSWTAQLGTVALLTSVEGEAVTVEPIEPADAARRLARSASVERRGLFDLYERSSFAYPEQDIDWRTSAMERDERLLADVFAGARLLRVRAPFPTDPRRVAEAILGAI